MSEQTDVDLRLRTRNRAILVGLMILGMLPLAAAVWLYYWNPGAVAGAQINRGALLQPPAQLGELELRDEGGRITAEGPRLWRVVLFTPTVCDDACFERMHLLRQLHRRLGRDEDRVVRLAAFAEPPSAPVRKRLAEYLPKQELVLVPLGTLENVLGTRQLAGGDALDPALVRAAGPWPDTGILVVDPLGNVIFFYGLDQIGDALLFDLQRLLRLSNIG